MATAVRIHRRDSVNIDTEAARPRRGVACVLWSDEIATSSASIYACQPLVLKAKHGSATKRNAMPTNKTLGAARYLKITPESPCAAATEIPGFRSSARQSHVFVSAWSWRRYTLYLGDVPTTNKNMKTCLRSQPYWRSAKYMKAEKKIDSVKRWKNNTGTKPIRYGFRAPSSPATLIVELLSLRLDGRLPPSSSPRRDGVSGLDASMLLAATLTGCCLRK